MSEKTLDERLAEAQARKDAAEARAAERVKPSLEAQLAKLEREAREAEAIDAASADHGEEGKGWARVEYTDGLVLVKAPQLVDVKSYHDKANTKLEAKDLFGRKHVIYPDKAVYAEIAAGRHGAAIMSAVADAVAHLAGWGRTGLALKSGA